MKLQTSKNSGIGFDFYPRTNGPVSIGMALFTSREDINMLLDLEPAVAMAAIGPVVLFQLTINSSRIEICVLNCLINLFWRY